MNSNLGIWEVLRAEDHWAGAVRMSHTSRKCWREGDSRQWNELTKGLEVRKFKGHFVWGHSISSHVTGIEDALWGEGRGRKNTLVPECRRPWNPGHEVWFSFSLPLCNVLIIVPLTTHLHISVFSVIVAKDYICYNWICTTQRTVGLWIMPLSYDLWMSVIMAPSLYNGREQS